MKDNGDEDLFGWALDICRNHHGGDSESEAANVATDKWRDTLRIAEALFKLGDATCDEIEVVTGISHQTASARWSEMKRDMVIEPCEDSGGGKVRRITRQGCWARVWRLASAGVDIDLDI